MIGRALSRMFASTLVLSVVAGCGLLGGASSSEPATSGPLELASIKVSVLKAIDTAPLWRAIDAGYFADEGLTVEPVPAASGPDAVSAVLSDTVKIGFTSYPAAFSAQAKFSSRGKDNQRKNDRGNDKTELKLVADGYAAARDTFLVIAAPGSGIQAMTPRDLIGKTVAVSATGTISDLATSSALEVNGVRAGSVKWAPTPFPSMTDVLERGDVDAAVMVEPWITEARMRFGNSAALVMDCAAGPTDEIPLAGWMATATFADQNPKTVAAFQRGLARAVKELSTSRTVLDRVLVDNLDIDPDVAALLTPGTFSASLDPTRLGRVLDLMHRYPGISKLPDSFSRSDLDAMIVPTAGP
jgi:NitT/TauT family transport system substrate-binding protein